MRSRVVPGTSWTTATWAPTSRLKRVDFPTLGRPTTATIGRLISTQKRRTKGMRQGRDPVRSSLCAWLFTGGAYGAHLRRGFQHHRDRFRTHADDREIAGGAGLHVYQMRTQTCTA